MSELASITNAKLVLRDKVIDGGLSVDGGLIASIDDRGASNSLDFEGDYLIPGLVELHTDQFEDHYRPRPRVFWNPMAALHAHDAQIAASGITTVYDAVRIGSDHFIQNMGEHVEVLVGAIVDAKQQNRLRADHLIHLRCELASHDTVEQFERFSEMDLVRLASLMDHTPGQRQFVNTDQYIAYYKGKTGMNDEEMDAFIAARCRDQEKHSVNNRRALVEKSHAIGLPLASHDDATVAHVDEAKSDGVVISEFPTTLEAAKATRAANLSILMGAPNVVRGKSHSGNISATELAQQNLLDVLSSDYVPFSLLQAAFLLPKTAPNMSLPQSIATVTSNPARAAGLHDRGELEVGKKADFVRITMPEDGVPIVRSVWRDGNRII